MKITFLLATISLIAGCAGKIDYIRPAAPTATSKNYKIIDKPREIVWNTSVPKLGMQFFVINNLDKSSGLINISYSGDPEKYIDCGKIISYVKNARGERIYDFAGAKAQELYEVMNGNGLFFIERKMSLDGRINLVFEDLGANQTKVTVNTRYTVHRQQNIRRADKMSQSTSDSISFNSGGSSSFAKNTIDRATECIATGSLEQEVLSIIANK